MHDGVPQLGLQASAHSTLPDPSVKSSRACWVCWSSSSLPGGCIVLFLCYRPLIFVTKNNVSSLQTCKVTKSLLVVEVSLMFIDVQFQTSIMAVFTCFYKLEAQQWRQSHILASVVPAVGCFMWLFFLFIFRIISVGPIVYAGYQLALLLNYCTWKLVS